MNMQTNPVATAEAVTLKPLVTLTPIAAQKLQGLIADKNLTGYGLRVFVAGGGCSGMQYGMAFENTSESGDFVFESQGMRVYLDSSSAMYLEGATVDYIESETSAGFRIDNPNQASGCSCSSNESAGCGGGGCSCEH